MAVASIPATIRAGDTLSQVWPLSDYPPTAGWVLRLTLINSAASYQAAATASGADHVLTVAAATTAAWAAGTYSWSIDATLSGARYTVATGSVQVLPDLAAATTLDTRSNYRKALEAAEAALATHGARAYLAGIEVGDRRQTFANPGEFLSFISRLRAEVQREDSADRMRQGLAPRNKLLVRFTGR
jgi:hypothetical protein